MALKLNAFLKENYEGFHSKEINRGLIEYVIIHSSSSSSCQSINTDFPDPLSSPFPFVRCYWHVIRATSLPYRHRVAVSWFELVVLPLLSHWKGSTEVYHLWARPYFSSSVLHVWFVYFDCFRDWWLVAVQLLLCWVLPPGLVSNWVSIQKSILTVSQVSIDNYKLEEEIFIRYVDGFETN